MHANRIRSIGWLYGVGQTIILTPCIDDEMHATKVRVTNQEFQEIRHDETLMKKKAAEILSSTQPA